MINKLTFTIVDTNKSKFEQAHEIYSWITHNIRYDVKAYLTGKSNNISVYQTLKKKEGICSDYALLFDEMCQRAGIKSKIIRGYTKGSGYYKGGGFYRAEHAWNIFNIDTTWYVVDATWGSGYLEKTPAWLDKFKYSLFKIPYEKKKLKFVKAPVDQYFNPNSSEFRTTHLPLDPKWQLSDNILTMEQFESNTVPEPRIKYDFPKEIAASINVPAHQQLFIEGMNGKTFNEKNNFDITIGYLAQIKANRFIDDEITKENYNSIEECYSNAKEARDLISIYKTDIDSVFIKRLFFLKTEGKKGARLHSSITKELASEKNRFSKKERDLNKYQNILTKRLNYYKQVKFIFERPYVPPKVQKLKIDSASFSDIEYMLSMSSEKIEQYILQIDTMITVFSKDISTDSSLYTSYTVSKQAFIKHLIAFKDILNTEDITLIYPHWHQIVCFQDTCKRSLLFKQNNQSTIRQKYNAILFIINLLSTEYRTQIELLKKYYSYTGDEKQTALMFDKNQTMQNGCFVKLISLIENYIDYHHRLIDFNENIHQFNLAITNSKSIVNINNFIRLNDEIYANEKRKFTNEKKLIRETQNEVSYYHHAMEDKLNSLKAMESKSN